MALLAVARFDAITGLPQDEVVNTFAFVGGTEMTAAELELLGQGVVDFYNGNPVEQTNSVARGISKAELSTLQDHERTLQQLDRRQRPNGSPPVAPGPRS